MKRWFIAAALLITALPYVAVRLDFGSWQSRVQWIGPRRPDFLTPDHKPTAKLPADKYA